MGSEGGRSKGKDEGNMGWGGMGGTHYTICKVGHMCLLFLPRSMLSLRKIDVCVEDLPICFFLTHSFIKCSLLPISVAAVLLDTRLGYSTCAAIISFSFSPSLPPSFPSLLFPLSSSLPLPSLSLSLFFLSLSLSFLPLRFPSSPSLSQWLALTPRPPQPLTLRHTKVADSVGTYLL